MTTSRTNSFDWHGPDGAKCTVTVRESLMSDNNNLSDFTRGVMYWRIIDSIVQRDNKDMPEDKQLNRADIVGQEPVVDEHGNVVLDNNNDPVLRYTHETMVSDWSFAFIDMILRTDMTGDPPVQWRRVEYMTAEQLFQLFDQVVYDTSLADFVHTWQRALREVNGEVVDPE